LCPSSFCPAEFIQGFCLSGSAVAGSFFCVSFLEFSSFSELPSTFFACQPTQARITTRCRLTFLELFPWVSDLLKNATISDPLLLRVSVLFGWPRFSRHGSFFLRTFFFFFVISPYPFSAALTFLRFLVCVPPFTPLRFCLWSRNTPEFTLVIRISF